MRVAFLAAVLCVAGTSAHAQFTGYGASFDSADVVNNAPSATFVPYASPNTGVDNLDGQNGWGSTDPFSTSTTANGGTQVNGGADYVGNFGNFFGDTSGTSNLAGAIGGNQRNATPTTAAPDVVPRAQNVSLYHALPTNATGFTLNVDFALTGASTNFANRDTFAFSLRTTTGAPILSINFVPTTDQTLPDGTVHPADNVTVGVGTNAAGTTGTALVLNSNYHLKLTLLPGQNGRYDATFTDPSSGSSLGAFSGTVGASTYALKDVGRFSADWSLVSATTANGGYTGAGSNSLGFDNLVVNVPEPSTYALLALGLLGLVGARRWHAQRA